MSAIADEIAELKDRAEKAERERDEARDFAAHFRERTLQEKSRHAALHVEARKALDHISAAHASLLGLSGAGIATDELTKASASLRKAIDPS